MCFAAITNRGPVAVPVSANHGTKLVGTVGPNEYLVVDDEEVLTLTIGDDPVNPVAEPPETVPEGTVVADTAAAYAAIQAWKEESKATEKQDVPTVRVELQNKGAANLRLEVGRAADWLTIGPGANYTAQTTNYVALG